MNAEMIEQTIWNANDKVEDALLSMVQAKKALAGISDEDLAAAGLNVEALGVYDNLLDTLNKIATATNNAKREAARLSIMEVA